MITPIELQSKAFRTGIGYDKKDVDNFINELLSDYETLYKENMELNDKINVLNEGINYYKTIEKTLQKALVLAEQTAEDTKEAAKATARSIEDEARANAQLILSDAKNDYNKLRQQTIQLIRQYESYKAQFKHLAAAQCDLLDSDAFHIQIANLDAFAQEAEEIIDNESQTKVSYKKELHKKDVQNKDSYKKDITKKDTNIKNTSNIHVDKDNENLGEDEDFEFLDIND